MSGKFPLLVAEGLAKSYKGRPILTDVSFSLNRGEIIGLVGPNGAGKTTSFNLLIGELSLDKGTIWLDGEDVTSLPLHKRAILGMGYLSQEPSIFRDLTVSENIVVYLEAKALSSDKIDERLHLSLEEMKLTHLKDQKAAYLSGGERRRVEIARALCMEPKILFLDEPFANIDPKTTQDLKRICVELKRKGITIFITDHNAKEIFSLVDQCLVLHQGEILCHDTPENLMNNPIVIQHYLGEEFNNLALK